MSYYHQYSEAFSPKYLSELQGQILASPYFTVNNLNRDFVGTKGFSLVFQRSHLSNVIQRFPYFKLYLNRAIQEDCNAFYLNPLLLEQGSRVDPHIDRSLRSYCDKILPPLVVSVLYIQVPLNLEGGELILQSKKRHLGQISPQINTLLFFQGDLTHSVNPVKTPGIRLSLVCEQYNLDESQLREIPEIKLESRAIKQKQKVKSKK
ncbi:2OG-Fe(II) oxygenase [Crocosphaera sp. XPORK-15E]|uniref:2OG-Fe(II) oxygenase n=1 Tax=Crocosphaera sp. XPORK-15E TaxID=3110247 RepID=UPI002B21CC9C|nr:2OG-Fe(II) oxygenase [Crocosphaera sp. XPORK-15E]MEA5535770.1 2OG-Fe(II) oxygenase [Crocosphaera sp. XPORK-15E]